MENQQTDVNVQEQAVNQPEEKKQCPLKKMLGSGKKDKKKEKKTLKEEIFSWIKTILAALVIATLFRMFIAEPIKVDGSSMNNTLLNNEIVLASKLDYLFGDVERGDVVICRYPDPNPDSHPNPNGKSRMRMNGSLNLGAALSLDSYTLFVKRVVALPGDTVAIRDGVLYVNGEAVENPEKMGSAPYQDFPPIYTGLSKYTLGADEYFVIGDNRGNSNDSRNVGPLYRNEIVGKVKCVLWPLNKIRGVE